jgi:transcriptional regulator with PAS, ATPase and Fis domain
MRAVVRTVERVGPSDVSILITGESGVGKEVVTDLIHALSPRSHGPLIKINCAALPRELIESELFGSVKGAYTGAQADREGLFRQADGGTLLLDEISEMPIDTQSKLLRVLQEKEVRMVGDTKVTTVDVRVIAASNENLGRLVEQKLFREDLYYRLSVVPVHIPPLRDRKEDIPLLAARFLRASEGSSAFTLSPETMKKLMDYDWPGNVRELENVIERLKVLSPEGRISEDKLPDIFFRSLSEKKPEKEAAVPAMDLTLKSFIERQEAHYIREAFARLGGDKKKTAKALDISLMNLYRKMSRYSIS